MLGYLLGESYHAATGSGRGTASSDNGNDNGNGSGGGAGAGAGAGAPSSDYTSMSTSTANLLASVERADSIPPFLLSELSYRWNLWQCDIVCRSLLTDNDFITVVASPSLCNILSGGRLEPGDVVLGEKGKAVVVGVAQHKLWVQVGGHYS